MSHLLRTTFIPTKLHHPSLLKNARTRPVRFIPKSKTREIFMPALNSTMTEDKIISWVKSQGDKLSKRESVVVVVESDKADMDVESFYDGYLAAIIVDEGSSAPVGSAIALLAESEKKIALALEQAQKSETSSPAAAAVPKSNGNSDVLVSNDSVSVENKTVEFLWHMLIDKARAKQLQRHEYTTEFSSYLLADEDVTIEDRQPIHVSGFSCGAISWLASAQVALASEDVRINAVFEIGELFELGIQLTYLLLLLALLGVGSFFVIRQVLVRRELDLSAKELQEQVRSGDASATELFELGAVMLRRKFYPAATKYLLQAIEKWDGDDQDLAQVYNALGVSYVRDEKLDKGIAQFENAVKLQPGYVTAWNNLGDAYEKKKDFKSALNAFEEVILFDPNNKIARPRRDALKEKVSVYKGVPVKSKKN